MISLSGTRDHPRYHNTMHLIGKFNKFLGESSFRNLIVRIIAEANKFTAAENVVERVVAEAEILELSIDTSKLGTFKDLSIELLGSTNYDQLKGRLFEQVVRFAGPEDFESEYRPADHSLEEGRVCDKSRDYYNGNCDKNVDVIFYEGPQDDAIRFFAYEVKCNINTFVKSILVAMKKGLKPEDTSNYQKLFYLNHMAQSFPDHSKVFICSSKDCLLEYEQFLKNHGFLECISLCTMGSY